MNVVTADDSTNTELVFAQRKGECKTVYTLRLSDI